MSFASIKVTSFLCVTAQGYYIYIETSLPRRRDHKARLVSPTLAAVEPNNTCQVSKKLNHSMTTILLSHNLTYQRGSRN